MEISGLIALDTGLGELMQQRPVVALATLFGAGVLTSFTPCIYPMIPITAGLISGANSGATPSRARTVGLTLTYVLGLALLYAFLEIGRASCRDRVWSSVDAGRGKQDGV